MIFALGSMVIVRSVSGESDRFLRGHSGIVNFLTVSPKGNMLASGEAHDYNSEDAAALIVWDFN